VPICGGERPADRHEHHSGRLDVQDDPIGTHAEPRGRRGILVETSSTGGSAFPGDRIAPRVRPMGVMTETPDSPSLRKHHWLDGDLSSYRIEPGLRLSDSVDSSRLEWSAAIDGSASSQVVDLVKKPCMQRPYDGSSAHDCREHFLADGDLTSAAQLQSGFATPATRRRGIRFPNRVQGAYVSDDEAGSNSAALPGAAESDRPLREGGLLTR